MHISTYFKVWFQHILVHTKYTEKDWVRLNVQHYPLQISKFTSYCLVNTLHTEIGDLVFLHVQFFHHSQQYISIKIIILNVLEVCVSPIMYSFSHNLRRSSLLYSQFNKEHKSMVNNLKVWSRFAHGKVFFFDT